MRLRDWIYGQDDPFEIDSIDVANFKKRNYVHFRDETISAKVREEEKKKALEACLTLNKPLVDFIRNFLLDDEQTFKHVSEEFWIMHDEDFKFLSRMSPDEFAKLDPREQFLVTQGISGLSRKSVPEILELFHVVSAKVSGYEKELFILKCLGNALLPVKVLRVATRLLGKGVTFESWDQLPLGEIFH